MNRDETIKILSIIKASYPQWERDLKPTDAQTMVNVWEMMLKDYSYNLVQQSMLKILSINKFPPAISEIIEACSFVSSKGKKEMTEIEAWGLVRKAISNSAYNSEIEFNKLPENIQDAIGSHDILKNWSQETIDGIEKVIGSNFMRSYKVACTRKKEYKVLPQQVKNLLESNEVKQIGK